MTATTGEARQRADVVQEWLHTNVPHFGRELLAGGAAGAIAKTCVAPLERTKILLMTGKSQASAYDILRLILAREGIAGLFRGNGACCLRIVPYAAIHFSVYEVYRRLLTDAWLKHTAASPSALSTGGGDGGGQSSSITTSVNVSPNSSSPSSHAMFSQPQPSEAGTQGDFLSGDDDTASGIAAMLPVSVASSLDLSASPAITDLTEPTSSTTPSDESSTTQAALPSLSPALSCGAQSLSAPGYSSQQQLMTQQGTSSTTAGLAQAHQAPSHQHQHPRSRAHSDSQPKLGPWGDLLAGSGAGATAVLLTYPLDMVRTRLAWTIDAGAGSTGRGSSGSVRGVALAAEEVKTATANATAANKDRIGPLISHIVRQEGLVGLYCGLAPTLYGIIPYAGLKFFVYGWLKQRYWESPPQPLSAMSCGGAMHRAGGGKGGDRLPVPYMLAFGGISGLLAQTMTYPLDVVRRRMQVHGAGAVDFTGPATSAANAAVTSLHAPKPTTWGTTMAIVQREGLRGLFRGLSINYVKVVPSTAIGFTTYDLFKSYLGVGSSH